MKVNGYDVKPGADLRRADLQGADLRRADLHKADLRRADLHKANLREANLRGADLREANLREANLREANLRGADLYGADLRGADLHRADLRGADLQGADLRGAYWYGANLYGADLRRALTGGTKGLAATTIAGEGQLVGWKKCQDGVIVKLSVPAEAKRSNATTRKCRAEYVEVLDVIGADEGVSIFDENVVYKVGGTVRCHKWNDNRWNECSGGIHFFLTREEAEDY